MFWVDIMELPIITSIPLSLQQLYIGIEYPSSFVILLTLNQFNLAVQSLGPHYAF